jgi:hypothetical protein
MRRTELILLVTPKVVWPTANTVVVGIVLTIDVTVLAGAVTVCCLNPAQAQALEKRETS